MRKIKVKKLDSKKFFDQKIFFQMKEFFCSQFISNQFLTFLRCSHRLLTSILVYHSLFWGQNQIKFDSKLDIQNVLFTTFSHDLNKDVSFNLRKGNDILHRFVSSNFKMKWKSSWKIILKCEGKIKSRIPWLLTFLNKKVNDNHGFFKKSKSQRYSCFFIKIMRKRWIFVKGYPFDCPNSKTKIFHNHQLNLIESELFKNLSFSQPFFRTKWFISFKLWWKKTTKSDFKIYLKLNSHRFSW